MTPDGGPFPMSESPDFPEVDRYRGDYELELERWFRRRFGWLCFLMLAGSAAIAAISAISFFSELDNPTGGLLASVLASVRFVILLGILVHFWFRVRPGIETREAAVGAASRMVLALGASNLAFELAILLAAPGSFISPLTSIAFWHGVATLFLPWTMRESLRPILPLFVAWAVWHCTRGFLLKEWVSTIVELAAAPLVFAPGLLIAWWRLARHRRQFRREASRRFFVSMRRELMQARRIHESLFPQPWEDGVFRFEYRYRPAQEIGGDFVHMWTDHSGALHIAIIDVTGHGLASAMTVNRLYGELERLRYEHPYLRPGSLLSLLNRYVLLTLAPHKIFATAALLRIEPREGTAMYANAGHPPVFLRRRNGQVQEFESTHPMLGALQPQDFGVEETVMALEPGDAVVAYTDGAFEARNPKGHKMGLARLREALRRQPPPPKWSDFLIQLVEGFSRGAIDDDILVASVHYLRKPAQLQATAIAAATDETSAEAVVSL